MKTKLKHTALLLSVLLVIHSCETDESVTPPPTTVIPPDETVIPDATVSLDEIMPITLAENPEANTELATLTATVENSEDAVIYSLDNVMPSAGQLPSWMTSW